MQIGKRDYFVTFGDALHHIVAAILAATHHRHHSHFDWFLWLCACACVLVLFGFLVCVARLARVCAHLVCLFTRLIYYIKNVVSSINTEAAVIDVVFVVLFVVLSTCKRGKHKWQLISGPNAAARAAHEPQLPAFLKAHSGGWRNLISHTT